MGGGVRVYNHLRETVLLCGVPEGGEAEGALMCKASVRGLEHAWLPRSLVEAQTIPLPGRQLLDRLQPLTPALKLLLAPTDARRERHRQRIELQFPQ